MTMVLTSSANPVMLDVRHVSLRLLNVLHALWECLGHTTNQFFHVHAQSDTMKSYQLVTAVTPHAILV